MGLIGGIVKGIGKAVKGIKKLRDKRDDRKSDEAVAKYKKTEAKKDSALLAINNARQDTGASVMAGFGSGGISPLIIIGIAVIAFLFLFKK